MPVKISCPHCNKVLRLKNPPTGKKIRCPSCQQVFVPDRPSKRPRRKTPPEYEALGPSDDDYNAGYGGSTLPPRKKKARKKKKQAKASVSNRLLFGGVGVAALVLVGSLIYFLRPDIDDSALHSSDRVPDVAEGAIPETVVPDETVVPGEAPSEAIAETTVDQPTSGQPPVVQGLGAPADRLDAEQQLSPEDALTKIGYAIHLYADNNAELRFPSASSRSEKGDKLLSWRVHLLPFLDQQELYDQFKLDEPWDSAANKSLVEKIPIVYRNSVELTKQGKTRFLVATGSGHAFEGEDGPRIRDFVDGTSNTLSVAQVAESDAVFWSQPSDYEGDGSDLPMDVICGTADGGVCLVTPDTIKPLLSLQGGERFSRVPAHTASSLTKIAQALHQAHDRNAKFPDAWSKDTQGQPLLSWRVHLLPLLGHQALYQQFNLTQRWDSPQNSQLLDQIPEVYQSSHRGVKSGHTCLQLPVGHETAFADGLGRKIHEFTDGTSNTIMLVEAAYTASVPWTAPQDLAVDLNNPAAGIEVPARPSFRAVLADGAVQSIELPASKKKLAAYFSMNRLDHADLVDEPLEPWNPPPRPASDFARKSLFQGKVTLDLPRDYNPMEDSDRKAIFAETNAQVAFWDYQAPVGIAHMKQRFAGTDIKSVREAVSKMYAKGATNGFVKDEVVRADGREWIQLAFIDDRNPIVKRFLVYATILDGRLLIVTSWAENVNQPAVSTCDTIMNSIRVK